MFVIGRGIRVGESDAVSSSGALNYWCPANPFSGQFTKTSRFYCRFITEIFTEEFSTGVTKISTFIKLETGSPSWSNGEAGFTWIKFEITTHLRVGRSTGRTESDFLSTLTDAISIDTAVIAQLQTELKLPEEGVVLAETTPVEVKVAVIAEDGEESGSCLVDGGDCVIECKDGYTQEADGSCSYQSGAYIRYQRHWSIRFLGQLLQYECIRSGVQ